MNRVEEIFCAVGLLGATILMFTNVVMRYVFNYGLPWSEEVVRYTILWVTFIGISVCARLGKHVAIDILFVFIKNKYIKLSLSVLINIIPIAFCLLMTQYSTMLVRQVSRYNQMSPALGIPFYLIYLCMPIGFGLCSLRYIQNSINLFLQKELEIKT